MDEETPHEDGFYEGILERYADMVYRLCLVLLRNRADAEDAFQNVFLKLCEARPRFNGEQHIKAWLITVAKNECINQLRCFWRRKVACMDEIASPVEDGRDRDVVRAVLELPLKYRDIVYLFYFEGYNIGELSRLLKLKEPTVKTRLRRGRDLISEMLKDGGCLL